MQAQYIHPVFQPGVTILSLGGQELQRTYAPREDEPLEELRRMGGMLDVGYALSYIMNENLAKQGILQNVTGPSIKFFKSNFLM